MAYLLILNTYIFTKFIFLKVIYKSMNATLTYPTFQKVDSLTGRCSASTSQLLLDCCKVSEYWWRNILHFVIRLATMNVIYWRFPHLKDNVKSSCKDLSWIFSSHFVLSFHDHDKPGTLITKNWFINKKSCSYEMEIYRDCGKQLTYSQLSSSQFISRCRPVRPI